MQSKAVKFFVTSAGVLLLALGTGVCLSNQAGIGFVPPRDPILMISMPKMFWLVGLLALGLGWFCLFGKQLWLQVNLVLWVALNFLFYLLGLRWLAGPRSFHGYWGNVAETFSVPSQTVYWLLLTGIVYLLIGSVATLGYLWGASRLRKPAANRQGFIKMCCAKCGGHVEFSLRNIGQQTACPHCAAIITLRKPDESFKMSCYFCQGHVQFPAHALGTKMPCPHCKTDITLVEPK